MTNPANDDDEESSEERRRRRAGVARVYVARAPVRGLEEVSGRTG